MATALEGIDEALTFWLVRQPLFFVATSPLGADGLVNCSPKGLSGSFVVLDERTVAYLDLTGSGVETIAHLRENGRIVLLFCAFEGRPRIIRLHGKGRIVLPDTPECDELLPRFTEHPGVRSVIVVEVTRVSESCGYGVPEMSYGQDRTILDLDAAKKGPQGLADYRHDRNRMSIDGLPGYPER